MKMGFGGTGWSSARKCKVHWCCEGNIEEFYFLIASGVLGIAAFRLDGRHDQKRQSSILYSIAISGCMLEAERARALGGFSGKRGKGI